MYATTLHLGTCVCSYFAFRPIRLLLLHIQAPVVQFSTLVPLLLHLRFLMPTVGFSSPHACCYYVFNLHFYYFYAFKPSLLMLHFQALVTTAPFSGHVHVATIFSGPHGCFYRYISNPRAYCCYIFRPSSILLLLSGPRAYNY